MADTFNDLSLARDEWLTADGNYKIAAIVIADCMVNYSTASDTLLDEYMTARAAERAAWDRYMAIQHGGEEVEA